MTALGETALREVHLEDMAKDGGEKEELDRLAIFLDELSRFSLYAKSLLGHVTYIRKTNDNAL